MSRTELIGNVLNWSKNPNVVQIWDYSIANVEILKQNGVVAKHVPLKTPLWYIEKINLWKKFNKSVGFCGGVSERRKIIFNQLEMKGVKVNVIHAWGEERDEKLAKNKIILNIHYSNNYKIFEQLRCVPWMTCGYTVISEDSMDNDDRCINVPYEKIVETVMHNLNN